MNIIRNSVIIVALVIAHWSYAHVTSAITYRLNSTGRFGEHLTVYCKARWLSYKYGIPLLYTPFEYSDELVLSTTDELHDGTKPARFISVAAVNDERKVRIKPDSGLLYLVSWDTQLDGYRSLLDITDATFIAELRELIALTDTKKRVVKRSTAPDTVIIGLHVRKGGGFDSDDLMRRQPLRFPADSYYLEQVQRIVRIFPQKKRYEIRLFTDDPHPELLVKKYTRALKNPAITFSYRAAGNRHNQHVTDDFFALLECDCLVRSASCFSEMAQLIGEHTVACYPLHCQWRSRGYAVDTVAVTYRGAQGTRTTQVCRG
jgi:hypothetical protein